MFYLERGPISEIHANMCISRQKPGKNKSLALNREPTCMASINTNMNINEVVPNVRADVTEQLQSV